MNQFMILLLFGVTTLCSARYLPKKEFIKNTPEKWEEVAKKIGLSNDKTSAAIDLMTFIQNEDIDSAEMDTNTQWKESMLTKCKKFVQKSDAIDQLEDKVGDIKWSDVENKTLSEKLDYWNTQYMTLTCEHAKMKTLKNMCILITQDEIKKNYMEQAKLAGLPDKDIEPVVNLFLKISRIKSTPAIVSLWVDNCDVIGDGELLEIDEKYRETVKYSDVANENFTVKMNFWHDFAKRTFDDCGLVCVFKAMKNFCVEFMSPVERKKIEDVAKQAGFKEDDIPLVVDIEMRMNTLYHDHKYRMSEMMLEKFEKLGKDQQLMNVPSTETELEKLESTNLSEKDLEQSFDFWILKYSETTGIDHLKSLNNLCVIWVRIKPYLKEQN